MPHSDYYIYAIFSITGIPRYIGKGRVGRLAYHKKHSSNARLSHLYAKYRDLPSIKIRTGLTNAQANEYEIAFIKAIGRLDIRTGPLFNLTDGGDGGTYGRICSPETKLRMRNAQLGKKNSPSAIEKIRISLTGRNVSDATREKLRIASTGRMKSPETREKLRQANTGVIFTEERRLNMSKSLKGKNTGRDSRVPRKLSELDIMDIRNKISSGMLQKEIALMYAVSISTICMINTRRIYAWL